jgi:alpha-1,6-mannosyltransferase
LEKFLMNGAEAPSTPIKTLHITNYYHESSGGIRTFYLALLEAANQHRREVRLVVPGPADAVEEIGAFGRIYSVAAPHTPFFDSRYRLLLPHLYALPYRSRLREILRAEKPDLIEVCDKYTLSFLPSVIRRNWIDGVNPAAVIALSCERMDDNVFAFLTEKPWGQRLANWYMSRVFAPRFDGYISNSDYTAGELRQALAGSANRPCVVGPMGVDVRGFGPHLRSEGARGKLLSPFGVRPSAKQTKLLLYAGRLSPEKNLSLLPKTMERLHADSAFDYRMLIAGSGPLDGWLRSAGENASPGRILLLGQMNSHEHLAELYANCDVLVHPNPREPFGIVPLEAMASGLPVVAPRAGGVLSYANQANSWLAAPTPEAFAAAIGAVFADDSARAAKVASAQVTASEFSWPRVTAQFFALYDEIYLQHRPRSTGASSRTLPLAPVSRVH